LENLTSSNLLMICRIRIELRGRRYSVTVFVIPGNWKHIVVSANFMAHADIVLETSEGLIVKDRHGQVGKKFDTVGLRAVLRAIENGEEIPLQADARAKELLR
jgi:hypothetical protein